MMPPPESPAQVPIRPKIYHIAHVDRLPSIIGDSALWCDAEVARRDLGGSTIGMGTIKQRRLTALHLTSHPDLHVGDCVPFYFCPRSVMLYVIYKANHPELTYRGGQGPIVHLEADLHATVAWAGQNQMRWAFTTSNAASGYFEDYADQTELGRVDWEAIRARDWVRHREGKQAEFLIEGRFPWHLVERVGVKDAEVQQTAVRAIEANVTTPAHRPSVDVVPIWYY
jgi:hypothetical protein